MEKGKDDPRSQAALATANAILAAAFKGIAPVAREEFQARPRTEAEIAEAQRLGALHHQWMVGQEELGHQIGCGLD